MHISRHGLTSCPSCLSHIRVSPNAGETTCPFCDAKITAEAPALGRVLRLSRSGLLAASLLAAPLVGCTEPPDDTPDVTADMPANMPADMAEDFVALPPYGVEPVPEEDMTPDTD